MIGSPEPTEAITVRVDDTSGDSVVRSLDLVGPIESEPAVTLSALEVDPPAREQVEITVARPRADLENAPAVPHGEEIAYVDLEAESDSKAKTTLTFELDRTAIPDGLETEDVEVFRYADGEWTADGVTHDMEGTEHQAALPEASPVAVVALEPGTVEIVDADVPADWVRTGYETTANVTVRNAGDRPETRTLTLSTGGDTVAERDVSLGPGETATVTIPFEPTESGAVALDGTEVDTITVGDGNGTGNADGNGDDGDTTEFEQIEEMDGFGVLSVTLALLVAALLGRVGRRGRQ